MKKKAIIISIKGYNLSYKEKRLIKYEKPWGLILFKRNIISLKQVKSLIRKIKILTKDPNFPILIDEEGGTVSRLSNIIMLLKTYKSSALPLLGMKKTQMRFLLKAKNSLMK